MSAIERLRPLLVEQVKALEQLAEFYENAANKVRLELNSYDDPTDIRILTFFIEYNENSAASFHQEVQTLKGAMKFFEDLGLLKRIH